MRFHDLRHACASFLLAEGVSPRVAMEILGHSQISTTMDIYAHVIPESCGGTPPTAWTGCWPDYEPDSQIVCDLWLQDWLHRGGELLAKRW